jgi:hypothetical protein
MTIFHCLRFENLPTWRARCPYLYPPGTGWTSYTPRDRFPFSSPPTTRRATVEVFDPASTRTYFPRYDTDRTENHVQKFFCCCVCILCRGKFFTEPLPSNILIHILMGGIYEVRPLDGLRCHDIQRVHKVREHFKFFIAQELQIIQTSYTCHFEEKL